jgi:hypothetical protein
MEAPGLDADFRLNPVSFFMPEDGQLPDGIAHELNLSQKHLLFLFKIFNFFLDRLLFLR